MYFILFSKFLNEDTTDLVAADKSKMQHKSPSTGLHWETKAFLITLCMNLMAFMTILCLFRGIRKRRGDTLIGEKREEYRHVKMRQESRKQAEFAAESWAARAKQKVEERKEEMDEEGRSK